MVATAQQTAAKPNLDAIKKMAAAAVFGVQERPGLFTSRTFFDMHCWLMQLDWLEQKARMESAVQEQRKRVKDRVMEWP